MNLGSSKPLATISKHPEIVEPLDEALPVHYSSGCSWGEYFPECDNGSVAVNTDTRLPILEKTYGWEKHCRSSADRSIDTFNIGSLWQTTLGHTGTQEWPDPRGLVEFVGFLTIGI